MEKILAASLMWSPAGYEKPADMVCSHLSQITDYLDMMTRQWLSHNRPAHDLPAVDWLIIDNGVEHPRAVEAMGAFDEEFGMPITILRPPRNWGGGKNAAMCYFEMHPEYIALAQFDNDMFPMERYWATQVLEAARNYPDICAYILNSDGHDNPYPHALSDGKVVSRFIEFAGASFVQHRSALTKIGGFNVNDLHPYGYQDCEYGRRLAQIPSHLAATNNAPYINLTEVHTSYNRESNTEENNYRSRKSHYASLNSPRFTNLCQAYASGKDPFLPIEDLGPDATGVF